MFWKQLYLLLWKNFILRRRHWVQTLVEIVWPLILFALLVVIRKTLTVENVTECHYPARAMPSAGVYPWLKSYLCDVDNPCFSTQVPSEVPGHVNSPEVTSSGLPTTAAALSDLLSLVRTDTSLISNVTDISDDLETLASIAPIINSNSVALSSWLSDVATYNSFLTTTLSLSTSVADAIVASVLTFEQAVQLPETLGQRTIVCNASSLSSGMTISAPSSASVVSNELCSLTDAQLTALSSTTTQSMQPAANVLSMYLTRSLDATENSALTSLAGYSTEVQVLRNPLSVLQQAGSTSLLTSLFGFDAASPTAFKNFCDHPEVKRTGVSLLFSSGVNAIFNGSASSLNVSNSEFCSNLIGMFENNPLYSGFWNAIKPLIYGKIPYFPNSPLVRSVIDHANSTFRTMETIISFGENWQSSFGQSLYDTFDSGPTATAVRNVLASSATLNLLAAQVNLPVASLEQLKAFITNVDDPDDSVTTWKDLYRQLDNALTIIAKVLRCIDLDKFQGFDLESELTSHSISLVNNNSLWGSVVFLNPTPTENSLPPIVKYKIRQDSIVSTRTTQIQSFLWVPGAEDTNRRVKYFDNGFVHIQDMIENAIVQTALGSNASSDSIYNLVFGKYLHEMPYPCYTRDTLLLYLAPMMSLLLTLAWIYSVAMIIKSIVYEKEQRLKEVMKMMGLSNAVHWMAWFISSFIIIMTSSLLLVLLLKVGDVFSFSNAFILILWMISFATATIAQCFLISCFFTRANLAAACGGIIFFLLQLPYNVVFVFTSRMTLTSKIIASLLSSVAFGYGANYIADYEISGDGIHFSNWASSVNPSDDFSFLLSMIMMLVDALIYMTLAWYIENVWPGKYGVPKRWYFFATRSYWCGSRANSGLAINGESAHHGEEIKLETEPNYLPLGITMQNLRKVYSNGKVAVDDLSLNFYEGQITSFLGHNGAGKTTTMSMLTGLFTPTSGSAYIYGNNIQSEMDQIRHQLGFCPQYNVLFGDLTVLEHLQFYSGLKNAVGGNKESSREIEEMVKDVGLPHKKNEISRHLSGGMKRKLSVAVAFVGGSKCVILDEPTSGVDPYARRGIWDLLLRYRANRTILLSTHHMDEADLLGDRIAIISHGRLKCCGSSLFLKGCFGVGYYLTVVKRNDEKKKITPEETSFTKGSDEGFQSNSENSSKPSSSSSLSLPPSNIATVVEESPHSGTSTPMDLPDGIVESSHVTNLVLKTIPESKVHEENPRETTFVLPYAAQTNGMYSALFQKLDAKEVTYGLTDTSLEEIFLTVAKQNEEEAKDEKTKCCCCIPRCSSWSISPAQSIPHPDETIHDGLPPITSPHRSSIDFVTRNILMEPTTLSSQQITGVATSADVESVLKMRIMRAGWCVNKEITSFDMEEADKMVAEGQVDDGTQGQGSYKVVGNKLIWQQLKALIVKRFHHSSRNIKGFAAQICLPVFFIGFALLLQILFPADTALPALELQPWMYGDTNTFYSDDSTTSNNLSSVVSQALLSKPTLGMRCVDGYNVLNHDDEYISCVKTENGLWQDHTDVEGLSQDADSNQTLTCLCTENDSTVLLAECPMGAGGSATPRVLLQSSDWMYNMTGRNLSDWLVKTVDRFRQERFGGLSLGELHHNTISADDVTGLLQFAEANSNFSLSSTADSAEAVNSFVEGVARSENAKVWFDNNGYHAMPTWINILNNAAFRSTVACGADATKCGISVVNHPLDFTVSSVDQATRSPSISGVNVAVFVSFAMSFIPAGFVLFLIEEKVSKAKHLQFVSGVNQFIYWISAFIWDMINYLIPMMVVLVVFLCFQDEEYVSSNNFPCFFCLFLLYGFAVIPMMYLFTFYFEVPSTAFVALTCINIFIGVNTSIATFILELVGDDSLKEINETLKQIFLIFPQYCLGRGIIDFAVNQAYADALASFGTTSTFTSPFTFTLVGRNLLALFIEGIGFFLLTVLIQYRFFIKTKKVTNYNFKKPFNASEHDDDVVLERERLLNGKSNDILQVTNLTKVFKKRGTNTSFAAVDRLCIGVPEGECFGLLGVNGAGKTTTFKMLTGDTSPTAGDALICKQSILGDLREVQQNTGYCPQFEALNSLLTGREHLIFYAKLRGVPPEDIDRVADWAVNNFGLKMYANKPAGTYSGGNKRKLSAAIAFIGCPPIVFLDEPTAGMDPMSRRFLWSRIVEAVRGGRCIVLTSHSMEECEALCSRLAIMVNGKLKCLGSPQHLKNKYGEGYTITMKVGGLNPNFEAVKTFVESTLVDASLKESHCNMLMYQLPTENVKLADLFNLLEMNKKKLQIEDYSVSQTTLDEVFVNFAKNQTDGLEDDYGMQTSSNNGNNDPITSLKDANVIVSSPTNTIPLKGLPVYEGGHVNPDFNKIESSTEIL